MIVRQSSSINQYAPTFDIKNPINGQALIYNSTKKSFTNSQIISQKISTGIDGGTSTSVYGGTEPIDGGTP